VERNMLGTKSTRRVYQYIPAGMDASNPFATIVEDYVG
jgi:hypothetical protein